MDPRLYRTVCAHWPYSQANKDGVIQPCPHNLAILISMGGDGAGQMAHQGTLVPPGSPEFSYQVILGTVEGDGSVDPTCGGGLITDK